MVPASHRMPITINLIVPMRSRSKMASGWVVSRAHCGRRELPSGQLAPRPKKRDGQPVNASMSSFRGPAAVCKKSRIAAWGRNFSFANGGRVRTTCVVLGTMATGELRKKKERGHLDVERAASCNSCTILRPR